MKKLFYLLFFYIILTSCSSPRTIRIEGGSNYSDTRYLMGYLIKLVNVETPTKNDNESINSKFSSYNYEDDIIKIDWTPTVDNFSFNLENKIDSSIKIIWDDAVYVDENGTSGRIIHTGVKYTDKNNEQPNTTILKKTKVSDAILPVNNISYSSGRYGGWEVKSLFTSIANNQEEINFIRKKYIGKIVKILLPLKIKEEVQEYTFSFKIENVLIVQ